MALGGCCFQIAEHEARRMAQQSDQRLFGGVSPQRKRVADLGLSALVGEVAVDLPEHLIEQRAVLMGNDPLFKTVERGVIRANGEQRITGKPLEQQIVAYLKFELPQRPAEAVTDHQHAHQLRHRMRRPTARPSGVMKARTGRFERGEVQRGLQGDQKMIGGMRDQVGIDHGAEPVEDGVQIRHDHGAHEVG